MIWNGIGQMKCLKEDVNMINIQGNKKRFIAVAQRFISRDGIKDVLLGLEKSDFFTAPASTRFHDSEEGGLCHHSLRVYDMLYADLGATVSMESIVLVALFHDICKIGYYTVEMRNNKNEQGKWEKVPYYGVDDKLPFGHGDKSVFLLMQDIKLTMDEAMAIRWHMGLSVPKEEYSTMSKAFTEFPLALHLHIADMKATYLK